MSLFSKKIPKACPKCGKADGWHMKSAEVPQSGEAHTPAQLYMGAPLRGTYAQDLPESGDKKLHYRCDHCGYEKTY